MQKRVKISRLYRDLLESRGGAFEGVGLKWRTFKTSLRLQRARPQETSTARAAAKGGIFLLQ